MAAEAEASTAVVADPTAAADIAKTGAKSKRPPLGVAVLIA